jgi:hypothetical protein
MSPSTRSKPASASSPETGRAKDAKDTPFRREDPKRGALEPVEIELEVSRQRWIAWTVGGIVGGALLIWKLGTVGVWAGYVLIAIGLFRAYQLAMSFVHPPGKFVISEDKVVLPRGAHRPNPLVVEPSAVTAAYFLRRSVPWNRSAPVLVVELGERALAFPRDWFASEADQRHVIHALLGLRTLKPGASASAAESPAPAGAEPGPVTES